MVQGRYSMALADLGNSFSDMAVAEASPAFKVGRADNVAVGYLVDVAQHFSLARMECWTGSG